jgi:hypothetical protein
MKAAFNKIMYLVSVFNAFRMTESRDVLGKSLTNTFFLDISSSVFRQRLLSRIWDQRMDKTLMSFLEFHKTAK